ncbi:MAG: TetR/AcrR family transcriptional regulator [Chloroflexi bacterium]|nr:TetR/AcrR family transcriptional regulator [Chloroflexota bacterium]
MDKSDRRVKRTQKSLGDALIAVTLEQGYDSVTIKDITERADVAYSTFFRHYADKDALLFEILHTTIIQLRDLLSRKQQRSARDDGRLIFQHVAANYQFYRVLLSSQGSSAVFQRIQTAIVDDLLGLFVPQSPQRIPPEIIANHIFAATIALIRWWLDQDMPYTIERMGDIYGALIIAATEYVTLGEPPAS